MSERWDAVQLLAQLRADLEARTWDGCTVLAIAALAGFLPLVVANGAGAHSQQSLGTVIFGGLVVATVLSLGVVPPVYVLVKNLEQRLFPRQDVSTQQAKA